MEIELVEPLLIEIDLVKFIVPVGFISDLASVPRVFWGVIPPWGKYYKAAILHDYLYVQGEGGRKGKRTADDIFNRLLEDAGVGWLKRKLMYRSVRIFGDGSF